MWNRNLFVVGNNETRQYNYRINYRTYMLYYTIYTFITLQYVTTPIRCLNTLGTYSLHFSFFCASELLSCSRICYRDHRVYHTCTHTHTHTILQTRRSSHGLLSRYTSPISGRHTDDVFLLMTRPRGHRNGVSPPCIM